MKRGSLAVVGSGISLGQMSHEARSLIKSADKVLYCISDAATEAFILKNSRDAESLYAFYGEGKPRRLTYNEMVNRIMECVRGGLDVCAVFYGHPGTFVSPSHESIAIARSEGYSAKMYPAVSSLDCLFSDLAIDPAEGCQIFEATDLVLRRRYIDVCGPVIVLQIAAVGDVGFSFNGYDCRNVKALVEYLLRFYPSDFGATVYEASQFATCEPIIQPTTIGGLERAKLTGISTLFIPRLHVAPAYLDQLEALGLEGMLRGRELRPFNGYAFRQPSPAVPESTPAARTRARAGTER